MNNARILVVEDTPANLELVTDLLEIAGHRVLTATAAEPGLELARRERPDLILMDVGLPGMDGLEAARRLRDDPATAKIPVVALTAHAMRGDEAQARAAGCRAYLSKPIDTRNFARRVAELLATREPDPSQNPS
jgi:two-component system, cell cycle response regulator DivK